MSPGVRRGRGVCGGGDTGVAHSLLATTALSHIASIDRHTDPWLNWFNCPLAVRQCLDTMPEDLFKVLEQSCPKCNQWTIKCGALGLSTTGHQIGGYPGVENCSIYVDPAVSPSETCAIIVKELLQAADVCQAKRAERGPGGTTPDGVTCTNWTRCDNYMCSEVRGWAGFCCTTASGRTKEQREACVKERLRKYYQPPICQSESGESLDEVVRRCMPPTCLGNSPQGPPSWPRMPASPPSQQPE